MKIVIECEPEDYEFALEAAKVIIANKPKVNAVAIATSENKTLCGKKTHAGNFNMKMAGYNE